MTAQATMVARATAWCIIYTNKQAKIPKLQIYELLIMIKSRLEIMQNIAREQNKEKKMRKTEVSWRTVYSKWYTVYDIKSGMLYSKAI